MVVLAAPAAAQPADPEAERRANQERQRELDTQLDAASASEEQLRTELARLDAEVAAGERRVAQARARHAQAEQEVAAVRAEVAEAEKEVAEARKKAGEQAVQAYMRPDRESATALLAARDPQELATMKALVGEVAQHTQSIIQARVDAEARLRGKEAEGERAKEEARQAAAAAQAELETINRRRAEQAAVRDEMLRRIEHIRQEQAALDAQEEKLSAIIAERQRQAEAAKAAANKPKGSATTSGGSVNRGKVSSKGLIWPAEGPVTSGFGPRWGTTHKGVDVGAPSGAPIWAAADGEVFYASTMSGYGNVVLIDHGGGMVTLYAHQSRIASSEGQQVKRGQVIGYVGSTGNSTGPHLHFEVRINGTQTDPMPYLP